MQTQVQGYEKNIEEELRITAKYAILPPRRLCSFPLESKHFTCGKKSSIRLETITVIGNVLDANIVLPFIASPEQVLFTVAVLCFTGLHSHNMQVIKRYLQGGYSIFRLAIRKNFFAVVSTSVG